jgi:AbrB family looped-hinge helix DNA binding protein
MTIGTSKINEKGKITIPKEIREKLGIVQGDELIIDVKGNDIIIRKSETEQVSDILDNQEPWKSDSVEFQRKLREEWE